MWLNGKRITLRSRPTQAGVRRVYVKEDTLVSPGVEALLQVNATWSGLKAPKADWLIEPRKLRPGVYVARTLLPCNEHAAVVRVVNASGYPCVIKCGQLLGNATPAEVAELVAPGEPVDRAVSEVQEARTPDYLVTVVDSLPSDLSLNERNIAVDFVNEYANVFSRDEFDIGRTHVIPHKIDTGDNKPFRQALRRHPILHEQYIDETVDKLLQHDIIEPAASPWASNVVVAKKADGSLRLCLDFRQLNNLTHKDSYPLPRISSCLDALGGAKYFSTLDLRSGFWQTAMDPRDKEKTAFITRRGQFQFKVLSFGLANAPSLFQRIMELVLAGLSWEYCLVYVDDFIIFSKTFEEHVSRLSCVFDRLRNAGLKLRADKCKLFQRRVAFLGYIVSSGGIEPDPEKVRAVVEWPVPKDVSECRSFVGLCSYYRSFIKDLSSIASPLFDLTKKDAPFSWDVRCQEAFDLLKHRLTSAPVLAPPCDGGGYVLDVDACDYGIGAVLQQRQGDSLRVIGYASRTLSAAERVYCTTRKEQLAVVYGLKQFHSYVLGHSTIVRSDHAALSYLKRAKEPIGQQARWLDFLEQFDIDVQYRRGLNHGNADSLSRRPCETQRPCGQCCSRRGVGRGPDEVVARVVTTRRQARDRAEEVTEATPTSGIGSNRLEPIAEPRPAYIAKDRLAPVLTELKEQWSPEWLVERQK